MHLKEKIEKVVNLRIGDGPKSMIILVLLGVKPSVEVDTYTHNSIPSTVKETLQSCGLFVEQIKPGKGNNPRHTAIFCVSLEKIPGILLTTLVKEREERSFSKEEAIIYHKTYGALMGYPLSAIEGFIENKKLSKEDPDYPETLKDNPVSVFCFSKDHWKEEVSVVQKWEALLKKHAPSVLQSMQPIS